MPNLLHTRPGISFISVSLTTSGVNIVIPAHSQRRIRVFAAHVGCSVTAGVQWTSSNTFLSGTQNLAANQSINLDYNPLGWFEAITQEGLGLAIWGTPTGGFGGHITYAYVA